MNPPRRLIGIALLASLMAAGSAAPATAQLPSWGSSGQGDGQFDLIADLAVDADGNLHVSDDRRTRIQRFSGTGRFLTSYGHGKQNRWPGAMGTGDGHVFVTESGGIAKYTPAGEFVTRFDAEPGQDLNPGLAADIAVDNSGNVHYLDEGRNLVVVLDPSGKLLRTWGSTGLGDGHFYDPSGIAIGPDGSVYVTDGWTHSVQRFDANGVFLGRFGSQGWGPGQLNRPAGVATDSTGNVYVADRANGRVQKFGPSGNFLKSVQADAETITVSGDVVYVAARNHISYTDLDLTPLPPAPAPAPEPTPPAAEGPPAPPSGRVGLSINDGAQYTNDPDVRLRVVWPLGASNLLVANDGGFALGVLSAVAPTIAWRLDSSGSERLPKTVYARFGDTTQTFQDDIILDETPPKVASATLGTGTVATAAAASKLRSYGLRVRATDGNSGVASLQVASSVKRPGRIVAYRKRGVSVKLPARPRFVRALDRAGNTSPWRRIRGRR